jgi:hypothetical protein
MRQQGGVFVHKCRRRDLAMRAKRANDKLDSGGADFPQAVQLFQNNKWASGLPALSYTYQDVRTTGQGYGTALLQQP